MREALSLSTKEILRNPFLICDFIFEEDKSKRLFDSDLETLEEFFINFATEKNLNNLVKLFNDGHYERYYDFKHGQGEFQEVTKQVNELGAQEPVLFIARAIVNFFYGESSLKFEVEKFASEIASTYYQANKEDEEFRLSIYRNIRGQLKRLGF